MGPRNMLPPADPAEGDALPHTAPPGAKATRRLIGRIAGALQVPPASLYDLPNAASYPRVAGSGDASSTSLGQDCEALLRAYRRIQDPKERQRLLALVQEAAERA